MLPIVLERGMSDGLDVYVQIIDEELFCCCSRDSAREAIEKFTGQTGTDAELKEWIKSNRANLRFNPEAKMFAAE